MHSQQPPGVVQNWSTLQCSKQNTEQCGYDHAPVTRGRMRAQFPLPHGLSLCCVPPLPSCVALLFSCLSRPLVLPFLFFGHGITYMMVAAMTMTFAGMLCYYVCGCVCACLRACVVVPMRMCATVDGLFVLGFSHLVCLYVCLCVWGGGVAWIDA